MNLSVKGQHVDVGDNLRVHIEEKFEGLTSKYFGRLTDGSVTFAREGHHLYRANVIFHVGHDVKVQATAENPDPYTAFDEACDRVAKQLRRYKNRLRDHHDRLEKSPDSAFLKARDYILKTEGVDIEDEDEFPETRKANGHANGHDEHVIVAETTTSIPSMCVSDAVMRMDLAEQDFMLFKNPKTGVLNAVYRRPDGHIGWIDPTLMAETRA